MSITYQATPRRNLWVVGAHVVLDLRIENAGKAPFTTPDPAHRNSPQPVFEITPPGGTPVGVRPDARAGEWDAGREVTMLRVAPGETWEGDVDLSLLLPLEQPGSYTLRSWLETEGGRIESPDSGFEITAAAVLDLAAETGTAPDGLQVVECVQLLKGGLVVSTILEEADPANAELLPLDRIERGQAAPGAAGLLAPYSNFPVGLSEVRWILTVNGKGAVTAGCNVGGDSVPLFDGGAPDLVLPPLGTGNGLLVPAMFGPELRLASIQAGADGAHPGPVRTVDRFEAAPAAGTATLSPVAAGDQVLVVLLWAMEQGTRIRFLTTDAAGKKLAEGERFLDGWQPLGAGAAGWGRDGDIRASFGAVSMADPSEHRVFEVRLRPDLTAREAPRPGDILEGSAPFADVHLAYFEGGDGGLHRAGLVRFQDGSASALDADGGLRPTAARVPPQGPVALLPGASLWYVAFSTQDGIGIDPL